MSNRIKIVLVALLVAMLGPATEVAQTLDSSGQDIMLPIHISRCDGLHYPIWNPLWSLIVMESDVTVYFIDSDWEWHEYVNSNSSRCRDISAWCDVIDQCKYVQVVIDDPLTSHCWKSDVVHPYLGGYVRLTMYHYDDPVCAPDIVRP